jgi:hypothetical protein
MKHKIELTVQDVAQAIVEHINHSDLGVKVTPAQIRFLVESYEYGDRFEFEGAEVVID